MFTVHYEDKYNGLRGRVTAVTYSPIDFGDTTPEDDSAALAHTFNQFQQLVNQYHQALFSAERNAEDYNYKAAEVIRQSKEKLSAATRIEVLSIVPFVTFGRMTHATDGRITLWSDPDGNVATSLSDNYLWLELDTFPIEEEKGTWYNLVNVAEFYHRKGWRIVDGRPQIQKEDYPF